VALLPSSMLNRQGAGTQDPALLQLMAHNLMQASQQQVPFGMPFQASGAQGTSQQGSPQLPQWPQAVPPLLQQRSQQLSSRLLGSLPQHFPSQQQQQQQQIGFGVDPDHNDSSSSMNSAQVPQVQSRPANEGLLRMAPRDIGSSPRSSRVVRRGRSQSVGSMIRGSVQTRSAQQAQRDPQQGQGFPSMASLPPASPSRHGLRPGLMGPPQTALTSPTPSPSPDRVPRLGQALQQTIFANSEEATAQGPSNPSVPYGQGAANPYRNMPQDWANPFQMHANRPWGQSFDPSSAFEGQVVQQPSQQVAAVQPQQVAASHAEPGEHVSNSDESPSCHQT